MNTSKTPLAGRLPASLTLLVLLSSFVLSGCSSQPNWHADPQPATGRVHVNGEPAANALVILRTVGEDIDVRKSEPWAVVKKDGSFRISTYGVEDGVPIGEYAVTLTWPKDPASPFVNDRLNNKFDTKKEAPLVVTIQPGENELPPIDLQGIKLK